MNILFAFLILVFLGGLLGAGLAFASGKFSVAKDEKLIQLERIMPGANCGGCGFAGCSSYAEAVFGNKAPIGLCSPGGKNLADKMSEITGIKSGKVEKKVAFVFCKGSCSQIKTDFDYTGIQDCNAASILFSGSGSCKSGCLHLGSCISVCSQNAISKDADGQISVDRSRCIGCGKCVQVCPHNVIKLIPDVRSFVVACNSHEPGQLVRKNCEKGCIGCKICQTKFPESGFRVEDNLALSDFGASYEEQRKAADACPRHIIVPTD